MTSYQAVPTPATLKALLPLPSAEAAFIEESRSTIGSILHGEDSRLLLIIGPCSIHDTDNALEYGTRLAQLAKTVEDQLFVVMRVYYEKSRTSLGWRGLVYDPHLDDSCDIRAGLEITRKLLLQLTQLGLPIAAELLQPAAIHYMSDLLSWGCIGARTSTSQVHRQMASALPFPIGIKNSLDGNLDSALFGVQVAAHPQSFLCHNEQGQLAIVHSSGNRHAHPVLRGGEHQPNSDLSSVHQLLVQLERHQLTPSLLLDCSHGNSGRLAVNQIDQLLLLPDYLEQGLYGIRGALIESQLFGGTQPMRARDELHYGVSITDDCLGWEETEKLLLSLVEQLRKKNPKRKLASIGSV